MAAHRRSLLVWVLLGATSLGCRTPTSAVPPPAEPVGAAPQAPAPDDLEALAQALRGPGLVGWMHGSIPERRLWLFTYRRPGDFFDAIDVAVEPASEAVARVLATLHRHDQVRLRGTAASRASQVHVVAESVELVEPFEAAADLPEYDYTFDPESALASQGRVIAKVHAVGDRDRPVLVVDVGDAVFPVRGVTPEHLEGIHRGDVVRLSYRKGSRPPQPLHLELDPDAPQPIEVLDAMVAGHGEPIEKRGILVRFPQSPQIAFDVYALQSVDAEGVRREYTLVNFEDPAVFEAIREKLAAAWSARRATAVGGRNKQINPALRVTARGIKNVVSPNQANPQILLGSPDDLAIEAVASPE